jgi:hypothetical protein
MPDAPSPITSPPEVDGQPWDATSTSAVAGWDAVDDGSGEIGFDGSQSGDHFAGADRNARGQTGPWKQT